MSSTSTMSHESRLIRPRLRTERLELQPLQPRHAGLLYEAVEQDRGWLRRWLTFPDRVGSPADTLTFLRRMARGEQNVIWGVWLKPDPQGSPGSAGRPSSGSVYAGTIGLHRINRDQRTAVLGYWMRRAMVGQGIATEGAAAVLLWAFDDLHLARVSVEAATGNVASLRVIAKLGFVREGRRREAECLPGRRQRVDWFLHGLVRGDLRTKRSRLARFCGTRRPWIL
jgi:ribosomal-protein-serine acetyltransferase